tara:strand:- start:286 stop:600 length:315 start_codon:yes stop_codon:yes gene_type:complete
LNHHRSKQSPWVAEAVAAVVTVPVFLTRMDLLVVEEEMEMVVLQQHLPLSLDTLVVVLQQITIVVLVVAAVLAELASEEMVLSHLWKVQELVGMVPYIQDLVEL